MMEIIAEGLSFPEAPRWRDGYFYFSDFYRHVVERINSQGVVEVVARVEQQPSGLGWLPDGRLLVVSMIDRRILCQQTDGKLLPYADLSGIASWHCNDMFVDRQGRAYVGHFGFNTHGDPVEVKTAELIRVDPDGGVQIVARDLQFPNGTVLSGDGGTLIVAETRGACLTAFDVDARGELSARRSWAQLPGHAPDGICIDSESLIWVADPRQHCVVRVREGGEIVQRIDLGRPAYACTLGGPAMNKLYVCTAAGSGPQAKAGRQGRIECCPVAVAGLQS